jgi:hypothetical protein
MLLVPVFGWLNSLGEGALMAGAILVFATVLTVGIIAMVKTGRYSWHWDGIMTTDEDFADERAVATVAAAPVSAALHIQQLRVEYGLVHSPEILILNFLKEAKGYSAQEMDALNEKYPEYMEAIYAEVAIRILRLQALINSAVCSDYSVQLWKEEIAEFRQLLPQ